MKRFGTAHCYRCGYVWTPRRLRVRICARCKSPYYWFPKTRVPTGGSGLGIEDVIGGKRTRIIQIARKNGATNVRVFGSVARSEATRDSDVDILVDGYRGRRLRRVDLTVALEQLLGRNVDVVPEQDLFWLVQPQAVAEAIPL